MRVLTLPPSCPKAHRPHYPLHFWSPAFSCLTDVSSQMGRTDPQKDSFQQCPGDWLLFTFVLVLMAHRMLKSAKLASIVWIMVASLFPGFHSPSPPLTAESSLQNGKYLSCWWRINADCCRHLLFFFFLRHIWLIFNNRKWVSLVPGKNKEAHRSWFAQGWGSLFLLA